VALVGVLATSRHPAKAAKFGRLCSTRFAGSVKVITQPVPAWLMAD